MLARLPSGWAVIGEKQVARGYCLLYPDPVVPHLNALQGTAREAFLRDMARLGDAVLAVTGAVRINYEMLGNLEPALHAHVFPRFDAEPEALRTKPIFSSAWDEPWAKAPAYDAERDRELIQALVRELVHA